MAVSVFDEAYLRGLGEASLLTEVKKVVLLTAAARHGMEAGDGAIDWLTVVPEVGKRLCQRLQEDDARVFVCRQLLHEVSAKQDTVKLLVELPDGYRVETCIMRKGRGAKRRSTVCVSCQVGCSMACTFCATGTLGLSRNLTSGEIVEQYIRACRMERILTGGAAVRNVVYMGMGEPLANYEAVVKSIQQLVRHHGVCARRITLSTVGFDPARIRRLVLDVPNVSLALSLHAPNQELRDRIVPVSKQVDIHELLDSAFAFVNAQKDASRKKQKLQKLFIEYCMLQDVNDSEAHARELVALLADHKEDVTVNLIPYNPTDVGVAYAPPPPARVEAFCRVLREEAGISAFVRQEHGQDVDAACGQLAKKSEARLSTTVATTAVESVTTASKGIMNRRAALVGVGAVALAGLALLAYRRRRNFLRK